MSSSSKEYFNTVASQWDKMRTEFFPDRVREKAHAIAGATAGTHAADIGAGTGFLTEILLQKGLRVTAVDQSEEMLAELQKKFGSSGRLECLAGESEHLPFPDAAVDFVFANMYLHHVEHPSRAIGEMARILKPGGRLVLSDLDEHTYEFLRTEQHDRWLGFQRPAVKQWLTDAGLSAVAVDCLDEDCCTVSPEGEEASISIFIASGTKP